MAVIVKIDAKIIITEAGHNTFKTLLNKIVFLVILKINIEYRGCTKAPTPKSAMARLRIRTFEGVRKDGILIKVMMTKRFKTVAKIPLQALITIIDTRKCTLIRNYGCSVVKLFIFESFTLDFKFPLRW